MANAAVQHLVAAPPPAPNATAGAVGRRPAAQALGRDLLREMGSRSRAAQLMRAIRQQDGRAALLGEILLARGWITQDHLMQALSLQFGTRFLTAADPPPRPALAGSAGRGAGA